MIETITIDTEQWAALSQKAASAKKFLAAFDERDFGGIKSEFPQPHDAKHLAIALDYISEFIEIAAAPRPEAEQHSDFPSQDAGFGGQPLLWCDDPKQPTPRPVPASELSDAEIDQIVRDACHSDPVMETGEYCLTAHEVRTVLQNYGLARPAEPDGGAA